MFVEDHVVFSGYNFRGSRHTLHNRREPTMSEFISVLQLLESRVAVYPDQAIIGIPEADLTCVILSDKIDLIKLFFAGIELARILN